MRSDVQYLEAVPLIEQGLNGFADLPHASYAYLLGLYLGDGDISRYPRTWRLRVSLDMGWPQIMLWCINAMQAVFPKNRVGLTRSNANSCCGVVSVHSKQIVCLFRSTALVRSIAG